MELIILAVDREFDFSLYTRMMAHSKDTRKDSSHRWNYALAAASGATGGADEVLLFVQSFSSIDLDERC